MTKGILKEKDVLINKDGAWTGKVGLYNGGHFKEACINEHLFLIRGKKDEVVQEYLYYYLLSDIGQKAVEQRITGSAQPGLNTTFINNFPLILPETVEEQHKISNILCSVDSVIDQTQAVISQTQRLKKALMQEFFTRGVPGRHKKFKKTKIGEVPADWEIVKLKELLREPIRNGYSPNCPEDSNGHWMLGLDAVTLEGFNSKGVKPAPVDDKKIYDFVLQPGDILVSRSNTKERVGLAGVYTGNPDNCSYSDLLMRVRVDVKRILPFWLESILLSGYGRMYFEKVARGTSGTMVKIDRKLLEDFLCPLPDMKEQKTALTLLKDVQQTIRQNNFLINRLTEIKSALMHVLLTGEVRVKT